MQVAVHNKVKVYNLTTGKSLPEWLSERKKSKKLAGGENRIELLHDLEFPHFSRCMFRCPNGTHLFAAGDYPPRLKCFDVNQLSMKYSFNADMPIMSGVALSPDFRKFALRGEGRQITVHHSATIVDRVRVPHTQRGLAYNEHTCELLSCGNSHEVFRVSLETGCFAESFKSQSEKGVNHVDVFNGSGLAMFACENGTVEAWDSRSATYASKVHVTGSSASSGLTERCATTTVATDDSGLLFSCGTMQGSVLVYDIRLNRPLVEKDHMNSLPIVKTYFFKGRSTTTGESTHVLSADTRSLKIWNRNDGSNFTTLEAPADITDFCVLKAQHNLVSPFECDDSGVIAMCCDVPRVQVHFIPQLGVAPRWSSFLDTITEELEEKETSVVYDDYRFVPKEEMDALGISSTELAEGKVRPAMHGCYIENGLYRELKAVVDPSGFNRYVKGKAKDRNETRQGGRISKFKRTDGGAGLTEQDGPLAGRVGVAAAETALLAGGDSRFAKVLTSSAFQVDKENPEYSKLLSKIDDLRGKAADRRQRYDDQQFTIIPEEHEDAKDQQQDGDQPDGEDLPPSMRKKKALRTESAQQTKGGATTTTTMYEAKPSGGGGSSSSAVAFTATDKETHVIRKRDRARKLTLEERLKKQHKQQKKMGA